MSSKSDNFNYKAFKMRAYPTDEQAVLICKTFGCARKIWNLMLADKIDYYKAYHKSLSNTPAGYKTTYPYLAECDSLALANVQIDLQTAFVKQIKKHKFPNFKSRQRAKRSYTTNNQKNSIELKGKRIKLPKLGNVKLVVHRPIPDGWRIKSATIEQSNSGKFYISVLFEYDKTPCLYQPDETKAIGLDYSMSELYIDSNGNEPETKKFYALSQAKLAKEQRKLSRMIECNINHYKGNRIPVYKRPLEECKNIQKQRIRIAKISEHIANQRLDRLHKISKSLADEFDIICIEDLNMQAISKALNFGKSVHDNGWGLFTRILEYKLNDQGKKLIKVDKFYPSSQLCHCCGYRNPLLKSLGIRSWICPSCGTKHNRDINAAINILNEGLRIYKSSIA